MSEKPSYEELKKRIHELEQIELARKQAEEELSQLFSMSLDMICIADINTSTFIKINPAFIEVLGYSEDELLKRPFFDFIHPGDLDETRNVLKQKLQLGAKVINFENRYRRKDGSYRWFSWVSHPDTEKGVTYAIARDVTDWKQNEEALKKSKALLNATGRMASVGGWELDAETLEVTWTEETYRIHEIPLYQKPPLQQAINFFHPEDRPKLERAIQSALHHAEPYDMEIRFITAKGNHLWARTKCEPETVDGNVIKLKGTFQDITKRRQAEEQYEESVIKLKEAVKAGNVGLWDWDLATNKVFYSAEWKSQIGYADNEITDDFEEWRTRVHPDDLNRTLEKVQKSIDQTSKDHIVEFRFQHKDGDYRWIMAHSSIIVDENGKPVRMVGSHTDITEQKKAEEQLRQSENKLRSVLDANPFPIAVVGLEDDEIFFWSQSALNLFGHTAPTTSEFYEIAYPDPDYRAAVIKQWKDFLEIARDSGRPINTGEYKIACKDGSELICEIYATFLEDSLIVTFNDITDRKHAEISLLEREMQFRQVFENVGVGIALYQPSDDGSDFIFKDINPAGSKIGQKTRAEHIGKSVLDVYPGVKDLGLFSVFQEVWKTGVLKHHHTAQYKDCKVAFWVDNYVSKLPLGDIMAVYEDVTRQKQAEETLKNINLALEARVVQRTAKLEEASKELEDFVYSVSHDLRAPLRSISGFAQIIDRRHKTSLNKEGQHYFDNIIKASKHMGDLIDDLLRFSRMGSKSIKSEPVALYDVLKSAIETLSDQIKTTSAQIVISEQMPLVQADFALLTHVFINLIENAIKYQKHDETPVVDIGIEADDQQIMVSVADNGIGIASEYHEKIFNIFQRLHNQSEYPGTGIGLSAVKKAVQMMGGQVWVESELDLGSIFKIAIPIAKPK